MEKSDELVARFHSLQGNNLHEVKRSFNELVKDIRRDVTREVDFDSMIASINPKTKLESALKMEILIRFKRYDLLLDVLKSGNPMLIGKVLKCWKFFEVVFSKIDAQTLVDQIFPQTSFSARMKIITKLSTNLKNEELADSYFRAIENKYGLFVAKGLLPACSLDLIKSTVTSYKVIFSSRQLLGIIKRDLGFLRYYFDALHQTHGEDFSDKYSEVLRYVVKIDDQLFWELFKKYQLKVKFGHRMTPKLYENGKGFLTPSDYKQEVLKLERICKIIRRSDVDLHKFLLGLYPKEVNSFKSEFLNNCYFKKSIRYLLENQKYVIVNGCFREAYGRSIHEFLTVDLPEEILQLIPEREREVFVDKKLEEDASLIYMYPTKKSIPLLRNRIKYTSDINKRSELTVLLFKTCLFNKDSEGLLEVLKYMRSRHKNDKFILMDFLESLWNDTKMFNGEHWDLIYELLKLVMPNRKISFYGLHLMRKFLQYAVKNKRPVDNEFMKMFLKYVKEESGYFDPYFDSVECEKFYFESFAELLPQVYQGEDFVNLSCTLLMAITRFNYKCPKHKIVISRYPELMAVAKTQVLDGDPYLAVRAIKYCLKFEYDEIYERLYWKSYQKTSDVGMVIWYLRNRSEKVLEHIDDILTTSSIHCLIYSLPKLFRLISLLTFNGISQRVVDFALEGVHHEDRQVARFSAKALSYLAQEDKYLEIATKFLPPPDGKIDLNTMSETYVITQEALIIGLSNLNNPTMCLPLLLKFCIGDYMKYALGSLYRVTSKIPESKLSDFLNSLHQSAVSVRKHAVDLTTRLETKERVYNFLKASGEKDKHASLGKITFKNTLSYFSGNPSQKLWELLKANMKIIHEDDLEAFTCLVDVRKIPLQYRPQYVPMVYEILAKNHNMEIREKKYDLLTKVHDNLIDKIDVQFLKHVVKDTLLQSNVPEGYDFHLRSVFYTTADKQLGVLNEILDVLKTYIEKNWTDFAAVELRKNVYDLIRNFCLRAIKMNSSNVLMELFLQFWASGIKNGGLLEEYLLLQLTNACLACNSEAKLREYGVKVSGILTEWIELHGASIVFMFAEELVTFSKEFLESNSDERDFVDGLLQGDGDDFNNILVLNVIFQLVPENTVEVQFDSVLEKLQKTESSVVQIHLHKFLRSL